MKAVAYKVSISLLSLLFLKLSVAQPLLTKNEVSMLVDSMQHFINKHYYNNKTAIAVNKHLSEELKQGNYFQLHGDSLIKTINTGLKKISNDGHLYIQSMATKQNKAFRDWEAFEKEQEIKKNFGFTKVEILKDNTGYIKIEEFMHPKRSMQTAIAAMKFVENTRALIIDLRGNGGGYPGIMEYLMSHYFEGTPVELSKTLYANGRYVTSYSSDLIYGKLRVHTPLYVLVDGRTASAAEYFAYTLQAFKKAIVAGKKTAGGANRNEYYNLPYGFRMSLSVASPVIAPTGSNWEGTGVRPDIDAENPLEAVLKRLQEE